MRPILSLRSLSTFALFGLACSEPASEAPASAAAESASWVTHRDAAGAFEARFPSPPALQQLDPPRKSDKDMQLVVTNAQVAEEARLLVATKVVMTDVAKYDCESGLKGMVETSLAGMGCTASEDTAREVQGLPGRQIHFTCQKRPMQGLMRIVCDARKIADHSVTAYSMMAAYKNDTFRPDEATMFLDGFRLLGTP